MTLTRPVRSNFTDLTGREFGHWTVVAHAGRDRWGKHLWECECVCGRKRAVPANRLQMGGSLSCGCHGARAPKEAPSYQNGLRVHLAEPPIDQPSLRATLRRKAEVLRPKANPRTAPLRPGHSQNDGLARAMMILSDRHPEPRDLLDLRFALERAKLTDRADEAYTLYCDWEQRPGLDLTQPLNAIRRFLVEVTR